jgi:hypothetical protein
MARRRHYRGLVRFPGLGRLSMPSSVKPVDVILGGALGLAGSIGLQMAAQKAIDSGVPIPQTLASGSPVVGGLTTGGVLYFAQKKRNPGRAAGHALGAALAGTGVWFFGVLRGLLGGPVLAQTAGYGAPLFMNPRMQGYGWSPRTLPRGMGGPIFNNPNVNLARLGQLQGFGDENEDGLFPAP